MNICLECGEAFSGSYNTKNLYPDSCTSCCIRSLIHMLERANERISLLESPAEPEIFHPVDKEIVIITTCSVADGGKLFEHQAGGFGCKQVSTTGGMQVLDSPFASAMFDVLETHFVGPAGSKYAGWCTDGIDDRDADIIDSLLIALQDIPASANYENKWLVNRDKLNEGLEAWIPIKNPVSGLTGFLVWENSD